VLTVAAGDGTEVRATDVGSGRCVLIVHPGLDDGRSWRRVAELLQPRFRVVVLHRRQYRMDLPGGCSIAQEAADVVALAGAVGEPVLLVGHSSGGLVALEALLAAPPSFAGALLYEPPIETAPGEFRPAVQRAEAALRRRNPGRALTIFFRDVVRVPASVARLSGVALGLLPRWRALAARQIADLAAIDDIGVAFDRYGAIETRVVLLTGDRSRPHLRRRIGALAAALPRARTVVLHDQGHDANRRAPAVVAAEIEALAAEVES
jgi:pimeloyl-ACP methyl ester carboxylesterase